MRLLIHDNIEEDRYWSNKIVYFKSCSESMNLQQFKEQLYKIAVDIVDDKYKRIDGFPSRRTHNYNIDVSIAVIKEPPEPDTQISIINYEKSIIQPRCHPPKDEYNLIFNIDIELNETLYYNDQVYLGEIISEIKNKIIEKINNLYNINIDRCFDNADVKFGGTANRYKTYETREYSVKTRIEEKIPIEKIYETK